MSILLYSVHTTCAPRAPPARRRLHSKPAQAGITKPAYGQATEHAAVEPARAAGRDTLVSLVLRGAAGGDSGGPPASRGTTAGHPRTGIRIRTLPSDPGCRL